MLKRCALSIVMLVTSLEVVRAASTKTIRLNAIDQPCRIDLLNCTYPSAEGGIAQYAVQSCLSFNDQLARGAIVYRVDVKASILNAGEPGSMWFSINPQSVDQVERWVGSVPVPDRDPTALCDPPPHDVGFEIRSIAGAFVPEGLTHYQPGEANLLHMWTVSPGVDPRDFDPSPPLGLMEFVEVTVHYDPPPRIEFDITDSAGDESERKILISRTREEPQYQYPSIYQQQVPGTSNTDRDGRIVISGTVTVGGAPLPNRTIYLRVIDPPDPSLYLERLNVPNDNFVPFGGVLRDTSVTTDGSGRFSTILSGSNTAGDNFRVQASTFPDFLNSPTCDGANNCYPSGLLTMWKRIYVEETRMLQNGMLLTRAANAGDDRIFVRGNRYGGNRPFNDRLGRGDDIVIVHAPQLDRSDGLGGWYMETHTILRVTALPNDEFQIELGRRQGHNEVRAQLLHWFGPDGTDGRIGDGIARVNRTLRPDDMFDARHDLVTGSVFPDAFTEYVFLPDVGIPMPLLPIDLAGEERVLQSVASKWSQVVSASRRTPPNHQLLIIADRGRTGFTGHTISEVSNETSSWVFRGRIDEVAGSPNDEERWAMKTAVHELAHQWRPNAVWGPGDHCPGTTVAFDTAVWCLLADVTQNPAVEQERPNGIARFHAIPDPSGVWHSEYLEIRRHPEPFNP